MSEHVPTGELHQIFEFAVEGGVSEFDAGEIAHGGE